MAMRFRDRPEAGRLLAEKLSGYKNRPDVLVLALPRGGVPVAFEVANALNAPLDLLMVRKLGVPGQKELAMGAIATGGGIVLDKELINLLRLSGETINFVVSEEQEELDRRDRIYRKGRPFPELRNRTVIVVDDGIATGSTMKVAIKSLRERQPARIIVAVPTGSITACSELKKEVDEFVCIMMPEPYFTVGLWYQDFSQITDKAVSKLLEQAEKRSSISPKEKVQINCL
jgi:putative phosphoribosyl transferase